MYPKCFYGIGKFKEYEYYIILEDNTKPVIHPPRKIPLALQPKLDKELDEMVEQGIITPVNGPSAWVSALVILKKPNVRLRTSLDSKDLNKVIKIEQCQQWPTLHQNYVDPHSSPSSMQRRGIGM